MTKKLFSANVETIIENCTDCYWFDEGSTWCDNLNKQIDENVLIPSWCPLPDAPKEKQMAAPCKKVPITVYVPAGKYCEGYTFKCPMLQDGHAGYYCVIIPDSFWLPVSNWIPKHSACPSLRSKANALTHDEIVNHRLRIMKQAAKDWRLGELLDRHDGEEDI